MKQRIHTSRRRPAKRKGGGTIIKSSLGRKNGALNSSAGDQEPALIRLQKVLAAAGLGSRRQCEELITQGRVDIDGETVTELGTRVDPGRHQIRVDGQAVRRPKRLLYFAINKPVGIISTNDDPSGRPRVIDLAPTDARLFTIGRLDKSSSGLILVTNDGRLTDLLTHPRFGVEKTYHAEVAGSPPPAALAKLERGVHLAEGYAHAKRVTVRRAHRNAATLEIVLDEGRNREVRRLLARIGHKVMKLKRVGIGPLRLGNLAPGESRPLTRDEVDELFRTALDRRHREKPRRPSKPTNKTSATNLNAADDDSNSLDSTPIIDYSLPTVSTDADDSVAMKSLLGPSDASANAKSKKPQSAPIDLSRIVAGKLQKARRTVIGGQPSQPDARNKIHRKRRRKTR
ncbi:MAG TPA: pseudouridine synthase [Pirellulales bacterium]|jgi:23S rRNA pseudouridine2605 synthase